jgi:alkylation response protein AidB-like acyl-CoA dehydrogenase
MSVPLTPEQAGFRDSLREFLAEPRVREVRRRVAAGETLDIRPVHRWLGERGWLAVGWPREYGGLGRGAVAAAILHRELVRHGLPDLVYVVSICYVGNFLLLAGSDELKRRYLPRLASGELSACTLYSEPDAGSDLAALSCRAEPAAGGYRLHGTKTYSQATEYAQYGLVAARTSIAGRSRPDGITLFWVAMDAPNLRIRSVPTISDHPFSEVTLDGVQVPRDHVVGPPDDAWPLLSAALSIERTGLEAQLKMRHWLDTVISRTAADGRLADPALADRVVRLDTQVEAGGLLAWELVAKQDGNQLSEAETAMSKWYNTELARPISRLALDVDGPAGTVAGYYRESPGLTLSAGTSEIMLYAISAGHLRVHIPDAAPATVDDPDARLRRRLRGLLRPVRPGAQPAAPGPDGDPDPGGGPPAPASASTDRAWQALVKSNVVRLTLPVAARGQGLGVAESVVVCEELGRALVRSPYLGTVTVAEMIAAAGPDGPLWPVVDAVAAGRHLVALAVAGPGEVTGPAPGPPPELRTDALGARLSGRVAAVPFADRADSLMVVADTDTSGGALVLVALESDRVRIRRRDDLGHGDLFEVDLDEVPVAAGAVLCRRDGPEAELLLARIRLRQSGYLLGLAAQALDLTLEHTRRRRQFGQAVATFQHVSFRLAALTAELHAARTLVRHAAREHDRGDGGGGRPAAALALVAELSREVTAEAMQLHGACGFTADAAIQRYYRQAAVDGVLYGTPHRLRAVAAAGLRTGADD